MNSTTAQERAEILRQMNQIETMARGKVCAMRRGRPDAAGQPRVYYNHQCWRGGKNTSRYVSVEERVALQRDISQRQRFEALAEQFVDLTVAATQAEAHAAESKKNSRSKSKPSATGRRNTSSRKSADA